MIAKREMIRRALRMTHTATKPKTRVQGKVRSITAHMTNDDYDLATLAADCCELTDSAFGACAIRKVAALVLIRSRYGRRRWFKGEWWRAIGGLA